MKLAKGVFLSCVGSLYLSSVAFAYDFSHADELFKHRSESFSKATEARQAYKNSLSQNLTNDEKVYAVAQMGRLDIYRGAMQPGVDMKVRKEVLEDCYKTIDLIKDTNSQQYHYTKVACVAFRSKIASIFNRMTWGRRMKKAVTEAFAVSKTGESYEGGGVHRVLSAVKSNHKASLLGIYKPEEALEHANNALKSPLQEVRPYPNPLSGADYHENYYYVGQSQMSIGMKNSDKSMVDKGMKTLDEAIKRLDRLEKLGELPAGREPETAFYKGMMKDLHGKIKSCINESKWKKCLGKKL